MNETQLDANFHDNDRLVSLASYLLVSLMLACVSISVVQLGRRLLPGWQAGYLVPMTYLVALEAMYAHRSIRAYSLFSPEWLLRRLSEWVVILIVLKLAEYAGRGPALLLADIPLWVQDFKTNFFTADYLVAICLTLLIWGLSTEFAELISRLEVNEHLLAQEREAGISEDRARLRQQLLTLIMIVGAGLIVMATLLRSDWEFIWGDRPPLEVGTANLLVYFIFALLLLSLTQFSLLRVHWSFEEITINRDLAKRWMVYSSFFLILLVIIASLLPTQYTIGLLEVLGLLAALLVNLLSLLAFLLLLPVSLIFNLLMSLFSSDEVPAQMNIQPPPDLIPPQPTGNSWLELVASIIFWAIFIGVIGFAVFYYLQQRKDIWDYFRKIPFLVRLGQFWQSVRNWLKGINQGIIAGMNASIQRIREFRSTRHVSESLAGWISLRRLNARQRVFFYYLAMLRRSGEQGVPRHPHQTPYEYARELGSRVPEAEAEVSSLTTVFVEAKYSLHEVTQQHAGRVRQSWEKIKKVLKSALKRS